MDLRGVRNSIFNEYGPPDVRWPVSSVNDLINDLKDQLAVRAEYYVRHMVTGTVTGQALYSFPHEIVQVYRVWYVDNSDDHYALTPMTRGALLAKDENYETATNGIPENHILEGNFLRLYPPPSATCGAPSRGLHAQMSLVPPKMTKDTDTFDQMPIWGQRGMVDWALSIMDGQRFGNRFPESKYTNAQLRQWIMARPDQGDLTVRPMSLGRGGRDAYRNDS